MKKIILAVFLVLFFVGGYFYLSKTASQDNCLCTQDIASYCHADSEDVKYLPSACGCGGDAKEYINKGWFACPEKFDEAFAQ